MEKNRPKVGMGINIVNGKNQIFLMLRKGNHEGGTWASVGGHLEMGESFLECAKRELKEEAGLDLENIEMLATLNTIFSPEKHYVTIEVLAKGILGTPKIMEPEKCEKIGWFDLNNLPQPLILPLKMLLEEPGIEEKLKSSDSFKNSKI